MALLLGIMIAYEAQTGRCCIEPMWEVGEQEDLSEEQRDQRRALWKAQISVHADCMAAIHATRRPGASLRDQFKFGGCCKHESYEALEQVMNLDAHKGRELALAEGWAQHWKGNDAADQVAKQVRPKQTGDDQAQMKVISASRARKRQVTELCRSLTGMWEGMFRNKK